MALRVPESKIQENRPPQTSPQNLLNGTLGTQIGLYGRGIQHGNGPSNQPTFEPYELSGTAKNTVKTTFTVYIVLTLRLSLQPCFKCIQSQQVGWWFDLYCSVNLIILFPRVRHLSLSWRFS